VTSNDERISVHRSIASPASAVFAAISDPQKHPEIDGSGMLVAADSTPLGQVGDTFEVDMHQDPYGDYRMENHVTVFEPDSALEWRPQLLGGGGSGVVYGYVLSADGSTTEVESYYDWSAVSQEAKDGGFKPVISTAHLEQSLVNLETIVQGS
jgi:uncharacterized protein YndB with AHSA1/START domain